MSERSSQASTPHNGDGSDSGSDPEEEAFEVEAILAEKCFMGVTKYLVKWDGYDLMNATWEPADQFDSDETLTDWSRKKSLIEAERERRFDVKRWERDLKRIQAKFESSGKSLIEENASLNTDFDSYFIPLPVRPNLSTPPFVKNLRTRRESRVSISSDVSSLFVSADTVSPGQPPAPGSVSQNDPTKPASGNSQSSEITRPQVQAVKTAGGVVRIAPKKVPQRQADNQSTDQLNTSAHNQIARKSQQQQSARKLSDPGSRSQSSSARPSLFEPGQPFRPSNERRSGREMVPDISQLELLKPSDFPSRHNYGHIAITSKKGAEDHISGNNSLPPDAAEAGSTALGPSKDHMSGNNPLPPDASEAGVTALGPSNLPSSLQSTGANRSERPSGIQAPDTTIRLARSPPCMPKADRLSSRDRSPGRDNPPRLPDFAERSTAAAENNCRHSSDASRQKPPSVYSRRESPGVSNPRRLLDSDSHRRSPDPPFRQGPLDSFRRGGDYYRPGGRERPSECEEGSPSHRHPSVQSTNGTSTFGQSYHEIARRNSISGADRRQSPPIVAAPRPSNQPSISAEEKEQIAQMPLGVPDDSAKFVGSSYFYSEDDHEVLVQVYFGVDKKYIGPVRLCGHRRMAKYDLLRQNPEKGKDNFEMWFKDLCTWDEYEELARNIAVPQKWCNSWMEGFEDTNEALFFMGQSLSEQNKAAIYYPADRRGLSWIAYSPSSAFHRRLTHHKSMVALPSGAAICLSVTGPLLDFSTLGTKYGRPGQNHASVNSTSTNSMNQNLQHGSSETHSEPRPWVVTESNRADRRILDETLNLGIYEAVDTPGDPFVEKRPTTSASPADAQVPAIPSQNVVGINKEHTPNPTASGIAQMFTFFHVTLKITVKNLATLHNGSMADMFYLHFPSDDGDASAELELMKLWLNHHKVNCYTSKDPSSWERFHANCKRGVVIFHESFFEYDSLRPKIRSFQWKDDFNFWSVRLQRPLDSPDHRLLGKGSHIQRLFPCGTAILLTEDVFVDMKRAAMIICWFYHKHCLSPGTSKLVLCPDVMTKLEKILDDPSRNKDFDPYILSIITCIKTVNSVDPNFPFFEPSSLSIQELDRINNNVLCLPVAGYGQRTGDEHPHIPKGLTQDERNADHLVEAFAGWMQMNVTRFRRMAVVSFQRNEALLSRWSAWGHLHVMSGFKGFCKAYNTDETILHDRLQNGLQRSVNSPRVLEANPLATPRTPRTPQTPQETQDPRGSHRESRDPRLYRKLKNSNPNIGSPQPYR
ncbi:uncharacterized protein N7484_006503 [Penicillium longicatenatum]|uniref:uncharacterized protein n=1 Tax=Penicillium longicatenatum TaxID=1561947 RepID=UPI0025478DE3|nr:uncharacterized protein N7484_006503 [Penicillium longicatenatum]KAJ5643996.1 hypothetical protein N7484_006503 [Penicillium longicatenatum]